jgi:tetratricopeptide (TPR) repeat protein
MVNTAFDIAREIENAGQPHEDLTPRIYLNIYTELEQADEIEHYVEKVEADIDTSQFEAYRPQTFWARGKLLEINGKYEDAIYHYLKASDAFPDNPALDFHMGRCYRMNKEYRKAEEHFKKIIDIHPYWPEELYEFGLVYFEWGKYDKALKYFNRAQQIWEYADPEYKPALLLREKLAELGVLVQ